VYVNTKQATRVLSLASETASEAKAARVAEGVARGRKGSQLRKRREEQARIAGETAVGALEAQLQALRLSDVRAWNATDGCNDVTSKASSVFCARVAEAKAKIAAAKERDRLDGEIAALPAPQVIVGAETPVVDPYVTSGPKIRSIMGGLPLATPVEASPAAIGGRRAPAVAPGRVWGHWIRCAASCGGGSTAAKPVRGAPAETR
jgi:hypothetical protein